MKNFKKIFRYITSTLLGLLTSFFLSTLLFENCGERGGIYYCPQSLTLLFGSMLVFFVIISWVFIKITNKIGSWKLIYNFVLILGFSALIYFTVAHPYKILGADIGPYSNGQTVLAIHQSLRFEKPIVKGNLVIFERSSTGPTSVALVVGVPGQKLEEKAYYLSKEPVNESVAPGGFFLVRYGDGKTLWAKPDSQITYVVWYGL